MTLKMILAMPQAKQLGLTKEKVEKLLLEINKKNQVGNGQQLIMMMG